MSLLGFLGGLLGLGSGPSRKIEVSKASAASGLQIIYGHRRVEPVPVFKVVSRNEMKISITGAYDHYQAPLSTKGEKGGGLRDNNDWLHRIDVWGQGPIERIERFWLDGDISNGGRFNREAYFRAASKYGNESQAAASELAAGHAEWDGSHQGKGVAYTWGRYYNSEKKPEFNSEPELNALVKGLRVYDPRVVTQSFSDPATWTYSNNRALVVLNYMMGSFGFNAAMSELDLPSFMAAADACDETMPIPAPAFNATGALIISRYNHIFGTFPSIAINENFARWAEDERETVVGGISTWGHPKYVANAVLDPKTGVVSNTKTLLEGMGWALPWSNGKHKLIIEGPVAGPVMTFDQDSILGGWTIERGMRAGRLNRVTVEFPNGNKDYEKDTVGWPTLTSTEYSGYLAEDNAQELHTNVPVETITNFYAAQAYAEYLVRKSRVKIKIEGLMLSPKAMLLEPGDVIALTYPEKNFSNTQFIVERVNISALLDVRVDLILYDPTVYGAPALVQEPVAGSPYTPEIWQDPSPVVNLQLEAVYETNADGSVISNLRVSWDDPLQAVGILSYEVRWKKTADLVFENALSLTGASLSAVIPGLVNDTNYTVEVDYTTRKNQTADVATKTITLASVATKLLGIDDGATRTFPKGPYDDFVTYSYGDVVSYLGSSYIFSAVAPVVGEEPGTGLSWKLLASVGGYTDIRFQRAAVPSIVNTDPNPLGWIDGPPPVDGNPLWMSTASKNGDGSLIGTWSAPQEVGGSGLEVEYSADGATVWHVPPFVSGTDLFMRQRLTGELAWSSAIRIVGEAGAGGLNNAVVLIYQRSASVPALPLADTTYTFSTKSVSGLPLGWTQTIPTGPDPLYVSGATASSITNTDIIAATEWSGVTIMAQNGADGNDGAAGLNSATVFLYQRSATLPGLPTFPTLPTSPATYTFATKALTTPNNGWTQTVPAGTLPIYVTTATAVSNLATDTIDPLEWAAPQILAQNGDTGAPGAIWFSGAGQPLGSTGSIGDYFLDTSSGNVYTKASAISWAVNGNIAGKDGDKWHSGTGVPAVGLGTDGDRYLRTDTQDVYVKAAGTWSIDTNIQGAPGATNLSVAWTLNEQPGVGVHNSWCWVHGFDVNGNPDKSVPATFTRENGTVFSFGGTTSHGESGLYGSIKLADSSFYIVLDVSGTLFVRTGTNGGHIVPARVSGGIWSYYKANSGWAVFTPNSNHVIIGVGHKNATQFDLIANGVLSLASAPELGATMGARTADLLPPHTIAGGGSTVARASNGSTVVLSAYDAGLSATITVHDFKLYLGDLVVNYTGGSISGLSYNEKYFVMASDATSTGGQVTSYKGGSVTYSSVISSSFYNVLAAGSIMVGSITTPASGGTPLNGGGGGFGSLCVAAGMYLSPGLRAGQAPKGSPILIMNDDLTGVYGGKIMSTDTDIGDCVELVTESGCRVVCSVSTPVTTPDGGNVLAPDMAGQKIAVVDHGEFRWENCVSADPAGKYVVAHISVGGKSYAAGSDPDKLVVTHNVFKP